VPELALEPAAPTSPDVLPLPTPLVGPIATEPEVPSSVPLDATAADDPETALDPADLAGLGLPL
jgi:hypothetical protein